VKWSDFSLSSYNSTNFVIKEREIYIYHVGGSNFNVMKV